MWRAEPLERKTQESYNTHVIFTKLNTITVYDRKTSPNTLITHITLEELAHLKSGYLDGPLRNIVS